MDRRAFLALAGSAVVLPAFAAEDKIIRIVSSLPRTGSAQGQTDSIVNGIRLAIADYEGKIAGFDIKYHDLDDSTAVTGQWVAEREADNAREAVKDKEVVAYIGTYNSGAAKVSMPILNKAGMVMISPAATWPGLTKKVKGEEKSGEPDIYRPAEIVNFCRVVPHDAVQGPLTAVFVARELKAKSVYVIDDKELYGAMLATSFADKCKELKVKVLGHESLDTRAPNYRELAAKIKKAAPDVVYFGGTTQSGGPQLAIDMKKSGPDCPLVVPDGCYEQAFIEGARQEALNGRCYATIGGIDPSQLKGRGAEFAKRYKEKFKVEPEAYAVYGYEAAKVVLEAIKTVGKRDRDAIRKAVLATKDFDKGALGKWSFDADGDTTLQQLTVSKIAEGKFVPVKVISADEK
jgi:branched-chain amino acid transport system substrate-binding protein